MYIGILVLHTRSDQALTITIVHLIIGLNYCSISSPQKNIVTEITKYTSKPVLWQVYLYGLAHFLFQKDQHIIDALAYYYTNICIYIYVYVA